MGVKMVMDEAAQQKTVGQGLALGCLALGGTTISAPGAQVQGAFPRAWKSWQGADAFPVVRADEERNDAMALLQVRAGRGVAAAGWSIHRAASAELAPGGSMMVAGRDLAQISGVDLEAWAELARAFLGALSAAGVPAQR